jgi:hypothetical protein
MSLQKVDPKDASSSTKILYGIMMEENETKNYFFLLGPRLCYCEFDFHTQFLETISNTIGITRQERNIVSPEQQRETVPLC